MTRRTAILRQWIGPASALLAFLFLVSACFIYFRHLFTFPNPHNIERQQHAHMLDVVWRVSFYGSAFSFISSLVGLGWSRWGGLAMSVAAIVFDLMTLGGYADLMDARVSD